MKEKGFTLVETIGLLVILIIVGLIAIPQIVLSFKRQENRKYERFVQEVVNSAELYLEQNRDLFSNFPTSVTVGILIEKGYLKYDIKNPKTNQVIDKDSLVTITENADNTLNYTYPGEAITAMSEIYEPITDDELICYPPNYYQCKEEFSYDYDSFVLNRDELPDGTNFRVTEDPPAPDGVSSNVPFKITYPDNSFDLKYITIRCQIYIPQTGGVIPTNFNVTVDGYQVTVQATFEPPFDQSYTIVEYSFDCGDTWQTSNVKNVTEPQTLHIKVKGKNNYNAYMISQPHKVEIN